MSDPRADEQLPHPLEDRAPGPDPSSDVLPDDLLWSVEQLSAEERRAATRAPVPLVRALTELGSISLADTSLYEVTRRVATLAQATVPGADEVSVTFLDGSKAGTVAFTGDLAYQLDERQYEDGSGPCTDAAREGSTIPMFELAREDRYPGFVAAARRAGVIGTLSVGMRLPSRVVGALNMYGLDRDGAASLGQGSVPVAEQFARHAAVALANAGLVHSTQRLAEQLQEAMRSRAVIEQAKGVLVARGRTSPDEAFAHLVRESRHQGRKLSLVAADVLAEAQQEASPPGDEPSDGSGGQVPDVRG